RPVTAEVAGSSPVRTAKEQFRNELLFSFMVNLVIIMKSGIIIFHSEGAEFLSDPAPGDNRNKSFS
ncbi:MAG: hypothetical protein Q8904_15750, partial [Bacteroidota bacterium]|nr:hypothetical protein [Bacteroidota bacterium]